MTDASTIADWGTITLGETLYENHAGISLRFTMVAHTHTITGPNAGAHSLIAEGKSGERWEVMHSGDCPPHLRPSLSRAPQYLTVEER